MILIRPQRRSRLQFPTIFVRVFWLMPWKMEVAPTNRRENGSPFGREPLLPARLKKKGRAHTKNAERHRDGRGPTDPVQTTLYSELTHHLVAANEHHQHHHDRRSQGTPRSEWWIRPAPGRCVAMAIAKAANGSSARK